MNPMSGMNHSGYSPTFQGFFFFFLSYRNQGLDAAHDTEQLDSAGNVDITLQVMEL